MNEQIKLDIQKTKDGHFIVTTPGISTHGYGETKEEAIQDFHSMADDLFCELKLYQDKLSPHSKKEFEYLKSLRVARSQDISE